MKPAGAVHDLFGPFEFDAVVVGLHLRWDGVFQRPQHLLTRVARHVPVIVIEEPLVDGEDRIELITDGAVTIVRPHYRSAPDDAFDRAVLAALPAAMRFAHPLVWLYTPLMIALADAFPSSPLVFDAMDELALFADPDVRLAQRESRTLDRAAMVFCGGPSLYRSRRGRARNVRLYSSGVDVAFFERARTIAVAPALTLLPRPVFGYVGVIDERVDLALLGEIADTYPQASLAIVGPTAKIDRATLPRRSNIHYFGQQHYADLPSFLAGFDVALMPFALNASTRNISPTKTLEYLAAGKPVVSTAVPDVVSEYAHIVTIAEDRPAFVAALKAALRVDVERQRLADERTHAATWDAIAAAMLDDLAAERITPEAPPDGAHRRS